MRLCMTDTIDSPALPTRRAALTGLAAASALAALPGGASAQSASPPAAAAEPPLRTLTAAQQVLDDVIAGHAPPDEASRAQGATRLREMRTEASHITDVIEEALTLASAPGALAGPGAVEPT